MQNAVCIMDFCLCIYAYVTKSPVCMCVCVCVTGSSEQGAAVGQRPPVQTSVPGGGV